MVGIKTSSDNPSSPSSYHRESWFEGSLHTHPTPTSTSRPSITSGNSFRIIIFATLARTHPYHLKWSHPEHTLTNPTQGAASFAKGRADHHQGDQADHHQGWWSPRGSRWAASPWRCREPRSAASPLIVNQSMCMISDQWSTSNPAFSNIHCHTCPQMLPVLFKPFTWFWISIEYIYLHKTCAFAIADYSTQPVVVPAAGSWWWSSQMWSK